MLFHCLKINEYFYCFLFSDDVGTVPAVEGDRLNIKCDYSEAIKVNKVQWTKESDENMPIDLPNIVLSKKSQWYDNLEQKGSSML